MNLILIHLGGMIPDYFWIAAKQIRKYFKGNLYFIIPESEISKIESKLTGLGVVIFTQESLGNEKEIQDFRSISWMQKEYGDFWSRTFERLFYLEAFIRKFDLQESIHIENDVLIYRDPMEMRSAFQNLFPDRVAINPIGEKYASFAYGYIPNYQAIKIMNRALLDLLKLGKDFLMEAIGEGMVNEMMLLKLVADTKKIGYLPSLPFGEYSAGVEEFGCLFDPASYGQFIGGTGSNNPGWTGDHHFIGRSIKGGFVRPKFDNGKPVVNYFPHGAEISLANLHVHSKELGKYV